MIIFAYFHLKASRDLTFTFKIRGLGVKKCDNVIYGRSPQQDILRIYGQFLFVLWMDKDFPWVMLTYHLQYNHVANLSLMVRKVNFPSRFPSRIPSRFPSHSPFPVSYSHSHPIYNAIMQQTFHLRYFFPFRIYYRYL